MDPSLSTNPACINYKEFVAKQDKARRKYWLGRFPDGAYGEQKDAYDNDMVPALHSMHRALVTPVTLSIAEREKSPLIVPRSDKLPEVAAQPAAEPIPADPSRAGTAASLRSCALPPATGVSRRSQSVPATAGSHAGGAAPSRSGSGSRLPTHGGRQTTAASRASRSSSVASLRSRISEAVSREVARSSLGDYFAALQGAADRQRAKRLAMPVHLRTGPSPVDMGCPQNLITETQRALTLPVKMAVDPKWSTDLKKTNDKVGARIEYERRLSAATVGSIAPELPYMYPKKHVSNPGTPYFKPGQKFEYNS